MLFARVRTSWLLGVRSRRQPRRAKRQRGSQTKSQTPLVAKILERQSDTKIPGAQSTDHFLKIIPLSPGDTYLTILERCLHLQTYRFDCFGDFLCLISLQAL